MCLRQKNWIGPCYVKLLQKTLTVKNRKNNKERTWTDDDVKTSSSSSVLHMSVWDCKLGFGFWYWCWDWWWWWWWCTRRSWCWGSKLSPKSVIVILLCKLDEQRENIRNTQPHELFLFFSCDFVHFIYFFSTVKTNNNNNTLAFLLYIFLQLLPLCYVTFHSS